MLASALIAVISLVFFVYWFRYTCVLLLHSSDRRVFALSVASANRLSFVGIHEQLVSGAEDLRLDELERTLDRDYRVLRYLLEHSAGLDVSMVERRLLGMDYRLMRCWYRLVRNSSARQARKALCEMSGILGYFAEKMGNSETQQIFA